MKLTKIKSQTVIKFKIKSPMKLLSSAFFFIIYQNVYFFNEVFIFTDIYINSCNKNSYVQISSEIKYVLSPVRLKKKKTEIH